jgi:hypothetical protein
LFPFIDFVSDTGVTNMEVEGNEERHAGNWILIPELGLRELMYREKGDANCNNNNNNNNNSDDNR